MVVILHRPVNGIAREAVPAGERRNVTILDPAEPAFGRDPQSSARPETKVINSTFAQSIIGRVRFLNPPVCKVNEATLPKTEPQSLFRRIGFHREGMILMAEFGPREFFDDSSFEYMKQADVLVRDPEMSRGDFGEGMNISARDVTQRN
jgi:hypothetical protein